MADRSPSFATDGRIFANDVGRLIAKLSFTQNSAFGRFGRTLLMLLYDKLKVKPYVEITFPREGDTPMGWVSAIWTSFPRSVTIEPKSHQVAIYTDTSTRARISAALVFDIRGTEVTPTIDNLISDVASPDWGPSFAGPTYIHGLAMLARVSFALTFGGEFRDCAIAFYIDNVNCRGDLFKGYSDTKAIATLVHIPWLRIQQLGIYDAFGLTPADFNLADAPTHRASRPFPVRKSSAFRTSGR